MNTKICTKCKTEKSISEFKKNSRAKNGYTSICKQCHNIENKKRYDNNQNKRMILKKEKKELYLNRNTQICTSCNKEKELYFFSFREDTNDYRKQCKECISSINKIKNKNNAVKNKQYGKHYRDNNKEKIKNKSTLYYAKNKEIILIKTKKYYEDNIEKIKKRNKIYFSSEKGKAVLKNNEYKRRAKKKEGNVTSDYLVRLKLNAKKCYWCNCNLKNQKIHIDHYDPLCNGGTHNTDNLVVSCDKCNLSKNKKDPILFANSLGKLL